MRMQSVTTIILAFLSILVLLGCKANGQQLQKSSGLGLSDAEWKSLYGSPIPFERDGWVYLNGKVFTRSWARKEASRGYDYQGYKDSDYYVKYIEVVWASLHPLPFERAKAEVAKYLPTDARILKKSRQKGKSISVFYSSEYLAGRLFPGLAGNDYCVTPWSYGPGKFKVEYHLRKGLVKRVTVDVGEPHRTNLIECKNH